MDMANSWTTILTSIAGPPAGPEILAALDTGIEKRLVILWKPFGGNALHFYNESLVPIVDVISLYNASVIYFTNQARANTDLVGTVLFDGHVPIVASPSRLDGLTLRYPGGEYTFRDEYSLATWDRHADGIADVRAFVV